MAHVSAVLTNLDWTIERPVKGLKELRKSDTEEGRNAQLALTDLVAQLEPVRKRFFQDSYFPADTTRLQKMLGMTAGNLSVHRRKLEDAGYVGVT